MTNKVKAANDALAALVTQAFATARPDAVMYRNPKGPRAWSAAAMALVYSDDRDPEVLAVMSGPIYDLKISPEILLARRGEDADRDELQWDDIETLKTALADDPTLGGVVEDARISETEAADLDHAKWIGGGQYVTVRLLFNATSPAG